MKGNEEDIILHMLTKMTPPIESTSIELPNFHENLAYLRELDASVDWTTVDPGSVFSLAASEGRLTTAHVFAYVDLRFPNPKGEAPRKLEYQSKGRSGRYSREEIIAKAAQQQSLHTQEEVNYKEQREAALKILLPLVVYSYTYLLTLIKNGNCPGFLQKNSVGGTKESFEHLVMGWLDNLKDTYACYLHSEVEA